MSQSSLSPAVSTGLETFIDAKQDLDGRLAQYRPGSAEDDTASFLQTVFKYLPLDGQVNLANDIVMRSHDEELRQLVESIDIGLLRPMRAYGGQTPVITPSPRAGYSDSVDDLITQDIESVTRSGQEPLRRHCLARDGNRCAVSQVWDTDYSGRPEDQDDDCLECAHIIPFALGAYRNDEQRTQSEIWANVNRYFPDLRSRMDFNAANVNDEQNAMMMIQPLHREFGKFHFTFEATTTPNRYRVKSFPRFTRYYRRSLPPSGFVTFTTHDGRYPLPHPILLAVHAAIANILYLTGHGEMIEKWMRDLEGMGGGLARDGSTNVGDLLSVSKLPLHQQPDPKRKQRQTATALPGLENQRPRTG